MEPDARLQVFHDATRTILSKNTSPDLPFSWSLNPYRGCYHGCSYCYARGTHEYLDFGAGADFERKIVVKLEAPRLLKQAFEKPSWKGECIVFSGNTDCYQPLEANYCLTQRCLEVCLAYGNPVSIITKSTLIERDHELLRSLAKKAHLRITVSIPFWNQANARAIEPYAPSPKRRMQIVKTLAAIGLDVGVNIAPVIPGLSDADIPAILEAAKEAGARHAGFGMLRLPGSAQTVFLDSLEKKLPLRAKRIENRIREARAGQLTDERFGARQLGQGEFAKCVRALFEAHKKRLNLDHPNPMSGKNTFHRSGQLSLF